MYPLYFDQDSWNKTLILTGTNSRITATAKVVEQLKHVLNGGKDVEDQRRQCRFEWQRRPLPHRYVKLGWLKMLKEIYSKALQANATFVQYYCSVLDWQHSQNVNSTKA